MCDALVALAPATAEGVTIFAKNSDRPPDEAQRIMWSPPRLDGIGMRTTHIDIAAHPVATFGCLLVHPTWSWGAEHGVNEAGVAIGNEAIYTTLDPRRVVPALTGMDLVRLGLERADTATGAVEMMLSLIDRCGQGGPCHDPHGSRSGTAYWSSFLVADPTSAFVVETSGQVSAVEQVDTVRAISNRTTIPTFDATHRHPNQPVEMLVDPRWHASNVVLANRPVTLHGMQRHLRSHESCGVDGWSVCMHGRDDTGVTEVTASSMIAELRVDRPSTAHVMIGSPCVGHYAEVIVGDPFSMG